jgi:single-strand DNA-binding protein
MPIRTVESCQHEKKETAKGAMRSKSKYQVMKSSQNSVKRGAPSKIKKGKRLPDTKSKSIVSLKSFVMSTLRNHVQLLGNVGQNPTITLLESGKKVARFTMATNEHYKNAKGEKETQTYWHNIVAWGKTAEIVDSYVTRGKEIAVSGKLKTRSYTTDTGEQRYITEVEAGEILLLGGKTDV